MTEKAIDLIQFDRSGRLHRVGSGHFLQPCFLLLELTSISRFHLSLCLLTRDSRVWWFCIIDRTQWKSPSLSAVKLMETTLREKRKEKPSLHN